MNLILLRNNDETLCTYRDRFPSISKLREAWRGAYWSQGVQRLSDGVTSLQSLKFTLLRFGHPERDSCSQQCERDTKRSQNTHCDDVFPPWERIDVYSRICRNNYNLLFLIFHPLSLSFIICKLCINIYASHTDLADKRIRLCAMVDLDGLIREHRALIHAFQLLHPHTLRIIKSLLLLPRKLPKRQIISHNERHRRVRGLSKSKYICKETTDPKNKIKIRLKI